ncbi:MAG: hypothetical protein M3Z23_14640 [Acidobacteriota bacterium]|nr:hypothetical protein [Acidobacteriota bacterium]
MKYRLCAGWPALLLIAMAGCQSSPDPEPAIGEAYVGPATLTIRQEIAPKSATVATVRHGERLLIVQRRRRFLKVRTSKGIEGWTDERVLMRSDDIGELKQLSADAKSFPSQGQAATYDTLNIHTEPQRFSPSYLQVNQGEKVDVIGHKVVPRLAPVRKSILPPAPKIPKRAVQKSTGGKVASRIPAPPVPPPPGPPEGWMKVSGALSPAQTEREKTQLHEAEPVPNDDWTLVRTMEGQSGWVLTRRLFMAIPDEVAQYAEGRRITSYFSLGKIRDDDKVKDIWLWTTIEKSLAPYDFDSFRVFIWSLHRHRYETALIQRKLTGYYPVQLERVNGRPGFSVCLATESGAPTRKSYALVENLVKFAGERPCVSESVEPRSISGVRNGVATDSAVPRPQSRTVAERFKTWRKQWFP